MEFLNIGVLVGGMDYLVGARAEDDHAAARLVDHMFGIAARQIADRLGRLEIALSRPALESLHAHRWSGNVRELENILEHCFVLCQGEIIQREHLPVSVCPLPGADQATTGGVKTLKQVEVILIIEALRRSKGNQTAASQELGIDKSTLYRKLKAYDIKPEAYA